MMPFFFGTHDRRLFGIYEPAHKARAMNRAAVICAPWGNEYIYSHRTLRQLALRLSQNGFHVLRFDYYATGDSGGECGDTDYPGSRSDTQTAVTELMEITGLTSVSLVGLRFGAAVAAEVAAERVGQVGAVVLWEPLLAADSGTLPEPADVPPQFTAPALATLAQRLPTRSMALVMEGRQLDPAPTLNVRSAAGEPPWLEKNVQSGIVPVAALSCITDWLT